MGSVIWGCFTLCTSIDADFTSLMEHTMVIELRPPLTCVFVRERSRCVCVRLRVWQLFLRSSGKKREGYVQCCRIFNVRILFFRFWIEVRLLGGPQNHVPVDCVCERNHIISVSCFMSFLWNNISLCGNPVWGHLGNATGCPLWERFWLRLRC